MFKIALFIMPFLFLACATRENINNYKIEKKYSQGVEDSLRMIESEEYRHQQSRAAALERYRLMRLSDGERRTQRANQKRKRVQTINFNNNESTTPEIIEPFITNESEAPIIEAQPAPIPAPPKKPIIHTDPEEMAIEIEQKLTYFCMKNRKSSRFNDEESCQEFTNNTLNDCQSEFDIDDKNLLFCVEKKIR